MKGGDCTAVLPAGIPNITGALNNALFDSANGTGAFSTWQEGSMRGDGNWYSKSAANFDASRCSSIYGASPTVQPPALQLMPQIRY